MENRGMSDTKKTKRMKENKRERQRETDSVGERERDRGNWKEYDNK